MRTSRTFLTALFTLVAAGSAAAQDSTWLGARSSGSLSLVQARPQGAFGKNIGLGYGFAGAYLFRLDRAGILSIRADAGVVSYGVESRQTALSESVGGRIQVNVKTTNYLVPMSIGPQLTWPTGSIRPYVNAGIGGQAFYTESHIESLNGGAFATTTNQSDFSPSWVAGGGVYLPVYAGKANVSLDFGAQYLNGGTAQYLSPGSIVDLPNSEIRVTPMRSTTHLLVVRFGARIGL